MTQKEKTQDIKAEDIRTTGGSGTALEVPDGPGSSREAKHVSTSHERHQLGMSDSKIPSLKKTQAKSSRPPSWMRWVSVEKKNWAHAAESRKSNAVHQYYERTFFGTHGRKFILPPAGFLFASKAEPAEGSPCKLKSSLTPHRRSRHIRKVTEIAARFRPLDSRRPISP